MHGRGCKRPRSRWIALRLVLPALLLAGGFALAQEGGDQIQVEILYAKSMRPLEKEGQSIHRLLGEVALSHDSAVMHCDSAYVYPETNSFEAFGNVRVRSRQFRLWGSAMHYDGNSGQGHVTGKIVKLHDSVDKTTLYSDALYFTTQRNLVWYSTWGHLLTDQSDIRSRRGSYDADRDLVTVSDSVLYRSEEVTAVGDSLQYAQSLERIYFWGPTRVYTDESMGYGQKGWYDRNAGHGILEGQVAVDQGKGRIYADWAFFDRSKDFVEAKGQVVAVDSMENYRLYAGHARFWNSPRRMIAQEQPMIWAVDTSSAKRDTLYLRADRFVGWQEPAKGPAPRPNDSVYLGRAEGSIRAFRQDLQLVADTAFYNGQDSTVIAWREPFPYVWSKQLQVSSRLITAHLSEGLDSMHFQDKVLVAQEGDSIHYDQMSGKDMWAYLHEGEMQRVEVKGEGKVIFFMTDEEEVIAVNRIESPHFILHMKEQEAERITFYDNPHSLVTPIQDTQTEDRELFGFKWHGDDLRPHGPRDIIPPWLKDLEFYIPLARQATRYRAADRKLLERARRDPRIPE
ncbi:MAG: hypothetical protein CSA07_01810 [Bacteroidia bacterium]|nr:MAG: hypothetical protein CSA07_01810 [Bacteroidia bacterium]